MKFIKLTRCRVAIVDDVDFEELSKHRWTFGKCKKTFYARRNGGTSKASLMHRVILGAKPGELVDHINGDGLDNRRANLRICNKFQNQQSRGKNKNNTSGYKGVSRRRDGKFAATIRAFGKDYYLGYFSTASEAGEAYVRASVKLHGKFADKFRQNIIVEQLTYEI